MNLYQNYMNRYLLRYNEHRYSLFSYLKRTPRIPLQWRGAVPLFHFANINTCNSGYGLILVLGNGPELPQRATRSSGLLGDCCWLFFQRNSGRHFVNSTLTFAMGSHSAGASAKEERLKALSSSSSTLVYIWQHFILHSPSRTQTTFSHLF